MRLLGEGNFGGVFHTQHVVFDEPVRDVAMKITKQTGLHRDNAREVFADAIMLARVYDRLTDPEVREYIVPVYDMGILEEHDGRGFIVMDLIRGKGTTATRFVPPRTLEHLIKSSRRGMPPRVAFDYFRRICTGMAAVHEQDVIHRDLKPDNILLTDRGQIRIIDFGLAAGLNGLGFASGAVGTHKYMAPETAMRSESDPRSDVYSLGIVLYEMLTGRYPFDYLVPPAALTEKDRRQWVLDQKQKTALPKPSSVNRTIKPWMDALVMDCLQFYSTQRPRNARVLLARVMQAGDTGKGWRVEKLVEADDLLRVPWWKWPVDKPKWRESVDKLKKVVAEHGAEHDDIWFRAMVKLAICYIRLEMGSEAVQTIRALEPEIEKGAHAGSYEERCRFYTQLADAFRETKRLAGQAALYDMKAQEAHRRTNPRTGGRK